MSVRNQRGQVAIIGVLIAVVLILILGYFLISRDTGAGQGSKVINRVNAPIGRAESVECRNNLQQIRLAINVYRQTNEQPPASLAALSSSGISQSMLRCPIAKQAYTYDATQGTVRCTTPGHGQY